VFAEFLLVQRQPTESSDVPTGDGVEDRNRERL
jgi:hypothetical protein